MKDWRIPLCVLLAVLALTLWNSHCLTRRCSTWDGMLENVENAVREEDRPAAIRAMEALYDDWQSCQTWLHVVIRHDEIEEAESLLLRCRALCDAGESSDLLAELADLRAQLVLLDETERISIRNIF